MKHPTIPMRFFALAAALLAFWGAAFPAAAAPLGPRVCTVATNTDIDLFSALQLNERCQVADDSIAGPRIWAFADVSDVIDPAQDQMLIVDPSSFDSFGLYFQDEAGNWSGQRYGPEIATELPAPQAHLADGRARGPQASCVHAFPFTPAAAGALGLRNAVAPPWHHRGRPVVRPPIGLPRR